jgi:hypothetical protein
MIYFCKIGLNEADTSKSSWTADLLEANANSIYMKKYGLVLQRMWIELP